MKSRICVLLLLVLIASSSLIAQLTTGTPPVEWTREFHKLLYTNPLAYAVAVDATGVYVGGDCLLTKLSKGGSELWYQGDGTICGYGFVTAFRGLATDGAAVYAEGISYFSSGNPSASAAKYDLDGDVVWSNSINSTDLRYLGYAVAASATRVYVAYKEAKLGDTFVRAYVPAGGDPIPDTNRVRAASLWTNQLAWENTSVVAPAIAADETGLYVTGQTQGSSGNRGFLRKYDPDGAVLWTRQWTNDILPNAIAVDATGVYIAGFAWDGTADGFVRKYDKDGNESWTRECGTPANDYAQAIATDGTAVYIIGWTYGAFPGYANTPDNTDVFVRKYDSEGNVIWTYQYGTGADEGPKAIAVDDTAVYVAGFTGYVGFVVKLNQAQMVPTLTLPGDQTATATEASGAVVNFTASATSVLDENVTVTCDPGSGSTFPLGTSTVNCTATDVHENNSQASFTVTVVDTTAPTLNLPPNVTADAVAPNGAPVNFSGLVSATDLVDANPTISCTPASGSTFAIGTTAVSCSATDSSGNTSATGSFQVLVKAAAEQVVDMIVLIDDFNLKQGIQNSLDAKLQNANAALTAANAGDRSNVCNLMSSVVNETTAQSGKALTVEQANQVITTATRIRNVLGCN